MFCHRRTTRIAAIPHATHNGNSSVCPLRAFVPSCLRAFTVNPHEQIVGRWLATLDGSATWDAFTEPDAESAAMKRRILLQASNHWYLSY